MAEKWQDPLEQLINQHRSISEYIENFEKISGFVHGRGYWKSPEFKDFLKKYFYSHFLLEEKKIFPVLVKKVGGARLKETVQDLYKEHEDMLAKVSKINAAVEGDEEDRVVFMLVKDVLNQLLEHASKEDDELLPVIQKNREVFGRL